MRWTKSNLLRIEIGTRLEFDLELQPKVIEMTLNFELKSIQSKLKSQIKPNSHSKKNWIEFNIERRSKMAIKTNFEYKSNWKLELTRLLAKQGGRIPDTKAEQQNDLIYTTLVPKCKISFPEPFLTQMLPSDQIFFVWTSYK